MASLRQQGFPRFVQNILVFFSSKKQLWDWIRHVWNLIPLILEFIKNTKHVSFIYELYELQYSESLFEGTLLKKKKRQGLKRIVELQNSVFRNVRWIFGTDVDWKKIEQSDWPTGKLEKLIFRELCLKIHWP